MRSMDKPSKQLDESVVPGGLNFSQAQVNWILGQSLASIYQDLLKAPVPENLQALLDQLDEEPRLSERHNSSDP